jgi:ABC-2 type transport system permease protein
MQIPRQTSAVGGVALPSPSGREAGGLRAVDAVRALASNLRIQWTILKTCLEERLVYRADFAFGTLMRFLPIVTQIFLWGAIYASAGGDPKLRLNHYTYGDMVAYYLLAMLARAFSSMPGLSDGIAMEIRDGTIKKYLTQPIDMLGYLFWYRVAHKLVYYAVATVPFALVFWLCRGYFPAWPDGLTIAACAASLVLAFLIGFLLEALIGLIGFWFLEVSSLVFIYMMINYFLSGHMIPLDWLPPVISRPVELLPFKYLAYFPAAIILHKVPRDELGPQLLIECGWVVALFVANRIAFARGVRRYGAFGG